MNDLLLPAIQKSTSQDLDPYYNLVSLHLKGDVNTGRNYNAFSDASSNNFRLTNNGDVRGSSFSPYGTSWSGFFGGGYITVPSGSAVTPTGTQSYCLEFFAYITGFSGTYDLFVEGSTNTNGFQIAYFNDGGAHQGKLGVAASGVGSVNTATITGYLNKWVHVVATRSGNDHRLFFDGVLVAYASNAISFGARGTQAFGAQAAGTLPIDGYMSNIRVCLDAIPTSYQTSSTTVGTSVFSAVTSPLTTSSQGASSVALITCHSNRFIDRDNGTGTVALTLNGTLRISSFSPFLETDTTSGSGYFDGTSDSLTIPANAAFAFGTGDFTIEMSVYLNSNAAGLVCHGPAATSGSWMIEISSQGTIFWQAAMFANLIQVPSNMPLYTWNHLAVVRSSGTTRMYVNGVQIGSAADTANYTTPGSNNLAIGLSYNGTQLNGNIANLRIVKGVAVYSGTSTTSANFTPPTGLLSASGAASVSAYPSTTNVNTTFAASATSLLTLQERGAYNTIGFQDESEYQHVITRSGNVAQGTFSPFSNAGWSGYFDGNADYLTTTVTGGINSTTFTVEFWAYFTVLNSGSPYYVFNLSGGSGQLLMGKNDPGFPARCLFQDDSGATVFNLQGGTINPNEWTHFACVKNGANASLWLNGTRVATTNSAATSPTFTATSMLLGGLTTSVALVNGHVSNYRLVSGTAIYDTSLSTIPVPTSPLAAVSGTKLLTLQDNRFRDASTNSFTITRTGDVRITPFSPFKPPAYDPAVHGGSGYFDGTGDYLTIVDNSAFTLANYNFCIELWIYPTASMGNYANFLGQWANSTTNCAYTFRTSVSQNVQFAYTSSGNGQAGTTVDGSALVISSWNHIVVCRNGTTLSIFQNGVRTATHNISTNTISDSSRDQQIGFGTDGSAITGYMSSLRFVTGNSIYDPTLTSITVPSGPLPILPNTSLLLNFTNAGVIDSTGKNVIETVGNAGVVTTAIKKYGTGSMYFDGTGDYLFASPSQNFSFGTGDFTIEAWFYTAVGTNNAIFQISNTAGGFHTNYTNTIAIGLLSGKLNLFGVAGTGITSTGASYATSSWVHVALVRSSGVTKLYLNGTLDTTVGTSGSITDTTNYTMQYIIVGGYFSTSYLWNGYIDDLRITRGLARYTANFTAPTKALPDRGTLSTLTTDMAAPSSVEALVVAGGGPGGTYGAGGGAGGYREFIGGNAISVSAGTNYALTIGAGGPPGAYANPGGLGSNGNPSVFNATTANGGGAGGARWSNAATNGASGGGGFMSGAAGIATPSGQGYAGGAGSNPGSPYYELGGGGGGAGGAGSAATTSAAGNGGLAQQSSITGSATYFAGGGGGSGYSATSSAATFGLGGGTSTTSQKGGGGDGGTFGLTAGVGSSGSANTGGGGGGGGTNASQGGASAQSGGSGGSGVVILAYPTSFRPLKASLGLVYTIDTVTRPGYRVYKFTAGTGTISW